MFSNIIVTNGTDAFFKTPGTQSIVLAAHITKIKIEVITKPKAELETLYL